MWVDCFGWEGLYQVSDLGGVRSKDRIAKNGRKFKGRPVSPIKTRKGYLVVNLTGGSGIRKQVQLHRLILLSFKGEPVDGYECCHNNGVRDDCRLDNLRWDSRKNNHADKIKHGTRQINEKNGWCKLTSQEVEFIRSSSLSTKELCEMFSSSETNMRGILDLTRRRFIGE